MQSFELEVKSGLEANLRMDQKRHDVPCFRGMGQFTAFIYWQGTAETVTTRLRLPGGFDKVNVPLTDPSTVSSS